MIPDFQTVMLPLPQILSDGKKHKLRDVTDAIADKFNLTPDERVELLPSGNQYIISSRVGWARTYLKKANLIDYVDRGVMRINKNGQQLLATDIDYINIKFLKTLPAFKSWTENYRNRDTDNNTDDNVDNDTNVSPQEQLEYAYQKLNNELAAEVLDKVKNCTPAFFEKLVVQLLIAMGYGGSKKEAGSVLGKSGDGGIDGIIKEDKLGLDTIYIQAKRYNNMVPIAHIRDFGGSLLGKQARKGVFISTGSYPATAREYVRNIDRKIALIDGAHLAKLMIEHNIGVTPVEKYETKELNTDYFEDI